MTSEELLIALDKVHIDLESLKDRQDQFQDDLVSLKERQDRFQVDMESLKDRVEQDHILFNERMDRHHDWLESFQNRMDAFQLQMIDFKEGSQAQREDIKYLKEAADTWFQGLEVWAASLNRLGGRQDETDQRLSRAIQTIQLLAESQVQTDKKVSEYHDQADKRMKRVEETVQQLAITVDRYLNARLNGQN